MIHTLTKSSRRSYIAIFCVSLLIFESCTFYVKRSLLNSQNSWEGLFNQVDSESKPAILLTDGTETFTPGINYEVIGDTIIGELRKLDFRSKFYRSKTLNKGGFPKEVRRIIKESLVLELDRELEEGPFSLHFNEVKKAGNYELDPVLSVMGTIGIIIVSGPVILALVISLAFQFGCPQVYTIDANANRHYQGSLLTGAMSKSMERTDLLPIHFPDKTQDVLKVQVSNEMPEKEYIDELNLLKTCHRENYQIGIDVNGKMFEYNQNIKALAGIASDSSDRLAVIQNADKETYGFNQYPEQDTLNYIKLDFPVSSFEKQNTKLIVSARQTELLGQSAEFLFSLYGTDFDKLTHDLKEIPADVMYDHFSKFGISMNAYLLTDENWEKVGTFHNAGTSTTKTMGIDLDLSKVKGENITIKLEAAFGLWELDFACLSQDWAYLEHFEEVPLVSARNESGEDIADLLQNADDQYFIQAEQGSVSHLSFENTAKEDEIYILEATGYYEYQREYGHAPKKNQIRGLMDGSNLTAQQLALGISYIQELVALNNE